MKVFKLSVITVSLIAVSFSTFAFSGTDHGSWHRDGYKSQQQYNDRPCDNYRQYNNTSRHRGMMQYSTSIQMTQPNQTLKKFATDMPKGNNGKQYMGRAAVVEITPNIPIQAQ